MRNAGILPATNAEAFGQSKVMKTHSQKKGLSGWYSRGYLPHFDGGEHRTQFLTVRLFDSLPRSVLAKIREELALRKSENLDRETLILAEKYLDRGYGECFLRRREIAKVVLGSLLKYDGVRYKLIAWVIMPNHIHLLIRPLPGNKLEKIMHSFKSFTASESNKLLGRTGPFWMREAFDRYIRDNDHFARTFRYIENNPVKARLCEAAEDWEFSSAWRRKDLKPDTNG